MARVRKPTTDAAGAEVPAALARFVFVDWHDPSVVAVPDGRSQVGSRVDAETDRAMAAVSAARARWRAGRESWADAHGMDWRKLPSGVGPVVGRP